MIAGNTMGSNHQVQLIPAKEGTAYIFIKKDDKIVASVPVTVVAARKVVTMSADKTSVIVSNASGANAEVVTFTTKDQYGNEHTLSEYRGKTIFLNFWATWCPPCKGEMPEIEEIYNEYGKNKEDIIILGVAAPNLGREGSVEEIAKFLTENNYTFPVVMDFGGELVYKYDISGFPTTFIINEDGEIIHKVVGAMDKETMKKMIESKK